MCKLTVAILFGGCSEEHDISVKSALEIARHIDTEKYEPFYIGITRSGRWMSCEKPCIGWEKQRCHPAVISPDKENHGLLSFHGGQWQARPIDVVFPVLHGKTGEDGAIQGLLELSGIPYIGCDIQSSVLCMDKSLAYLVVKDAGIATPAFWVFDRGDLPDAGAFTYPVFVKPARSGSSFGVSRVTKGCELISAIKLARQYDNRVIIESAVSGCEVGCAVLGNGLELTVGKVDQIGLTHGFFRIHQENKPETGSENAVVTVPADLPAHTVAQIQQTAKAIYRALGCTGLTRVDMFLQQDGHILFNEANTLPGFTSYSRYPRMMTAAGIPLCETIDRLITLALEG